MQPLENITLTEKGEHHCCVPGCWGWPRQRVGLANRLMCDFHREWFSRQRGEPFTYDVEGLSAQEARDIYGEHVAKANAQIPFHLIMATLWPGPNAEERRKRQMREKSLKAKWEEANDRN